VGLLDTSGGGGGLAGSLGSELLTGSLATSGLTCLGCQQDVLMNASTRRHVFSFLPLMMSHDQSEGSEIK
jgi:hypothetical protein